MLNKVTLIGNLGADPEIRSFDSGDKVANFTLATSESWKDKNTGEKKSRTEWHRVAVFSKGLVGVIENYVKKGDKLFEIRLNDRGFQKGDLVTIMNFYLKLLISLFLCCKFNHLLIYI